MELTADLNEVKVEKVKNEKELAKIDPKEKITGSGKDLKPIYKYLLDTPLVRREASFGIWKKKKIDSLKYEASIRKEWT